MNGIELGKTLLVDNLLSIRRKMNPKDLESTIKEMHHYCDTQQIKKTGSLITVTHGVELKGSEQLMDIELMIPVMAEEVISTMYYMKPRLQISNALYIRYEGKPTGMRDTFIKIQDFIKASDLSQITNAYSVNHTDISGRGMNQSIVTDIYIGINPCIM